ncbi:choline dehydrogenase, partial [Fusarium albosuccineum]
MASESYDIIIIGGGTAGLVLAARLSEDPDLQVLVIEAGSDQKDDPKVVTPALWSMLLKSSAEWAFDTTPQKHLDDRIVPFPQGRILGGSSAINGLVFTPIPKSNVEGWAKLGNSGWDWESFSQSFNHVFGSTAEISEAGSKGLLPVSYPTESNNNWPSIWKDTLDGLGFSVSDNLFTGQGNGFIVNPESIDPKTKGRTSSRSAFLEPSLGRKNLTVLTEAAMDKIIFDTSDPRNVVAKGVQYSQAGQTKVVSARKEIVLAAGTINSPMLLERSGVGSAELLQRLGIDAVVDNPYVGENLQNHMIVTISSEVKDGVKTKDGLRRQEPAVIAAATEAYGKQSGPFATSGTSVTAQLPFPGIETDEGKRELEQIFATTLVEANNGKYTPAFDRAPKEFVRSILFSPEEASGCYITFPGWAAFNSDGSMAPPPDGETNFFDRPLEYASPFSGINSPQVCDRLVPGCCCCR